MARILFKYGDYSAYLRSEHSNDTIYFIGDTQQIFKGDTLFADVSTNYVKFLSEAPVTEAASEGVLYVVNTAEGVGIYVKSGDTLEQICGGKVKEGAIADIGTFDDRILSKTADELTSGDDTKIPTAGAVKAAIEAAVAEYDSAFVDIKAEAAPEGEAGTVITLTAKDGSIKQVTVADIFLSSAVYDSTSHKLSLTLNDDTSSVVDVDLSDLIGNSLSDVVVGEDEAFSVELGVGGTLGGFKTGDKVSKDMTIENIVKKLLMKQVPPTYAQPSVTIANNNGTSAGSYEIGTSVSPKLKATFNKNDAGDLITIQFKKAGSNVGIAGTSSPATYEETAFALSTAVTYTATATYSEGAVKNDNLGQPYPTGHIVAGSKPSSNYTFTPYRQGYFMGSSNSVSTPNSTTIRGLANKKNGSYSSGTFKFTVPEGAAQVIIACPASNKGLTKVINESALNADVTSTFIKSAVDVEGADSYTAATYNVWTFTPPQVYSQPAVLAVTLG